MEDQYFISYEMKRQLRDKQAPFNHILSQSRGFAAQL